MPDAASERDLLRDAAEAAGRVVMQYFKTDLAVHQKADDEGPVTEADVAANDVLHTRLQKARPGYGWLSEETEDTSTRLGSDRVFIVDPIDGTRAFIAGEPGFAVSVAVAEAGRVIAAAVHLPARGETYCAALGGGALCNGAPIQSSPRSALDGASLLAARPQMKPELWPGGVPRVERSFSSSLAWRLCLVASGRFDAMVTLRDTWEWDIAAGALIVAESGAVASDGRGGALVFNGAVPKTAGIIAAPGALHSQLLDLRQI